MTGCTLKILDPTLKFYLGKNSFDSYEEFRTQFENKLGDGLIPVGNELKKISRGVQGYILDDVTFDNLDTLISQHLLGMLDDNNPDSHFTRFIQTAEIYNSKYNSPETISNLIKDQDEDFLKSTLEFYKSFPVTDDFKSTDTYQDFLNKSKEIVDLINKLQSRDIEPELRVDESTLQEEQQIVEPYIFTLTKLYDAENNPTVVENSDSLAILRHKVSSKVEQLMDQGRKFFMRIEPDTKENIQNVSLNELKDSDYGAVGVLYELVGNDYHRVYVKSNDNNPEGNIEITTNPDEGISLDKNSSKNLTFTLPDFSNPSYLIRDNPVNYDVIQTFIGVRERAKTTPTPFYEIYSVRQEIPVSPKQFKTKRLISLRDFLQDNKAIRLEIAKEKDRVIYAGNLFVRFKNGTKAALNRTSLNDEWKQRVFDLVNHSYASGEVDVVVYFLNKLLEYKGGDVQFFSRGNKIHVYRKSQRIKKRIIRLTKMEEVPISELMELLDYAKIGVDQEFLTNKVVDFPKIQNDKLISTSVNFEDFYKDHHTTIARQIKIEDKLYFTPIKSLQFDVTKPSEFILKEVAKKIENPKIGDLEIGQNKPIDTVGVVENLISIANETTGSTREILTLLHALLDNEETRNKLQGSTVEFTTKYDKDFKGLSNGKDILINYALLPNPNLLGDVLAHEIIHTLTTDWITTNSDHPLVQRLKSLQELVPSSIPDYNKTNIYELLASISNPKIAEELKRVKIKNKSLLEEIIDVVKQILGKVFGLDNLEPNLYNELITKLTTISTSSSKIEGKKKDKFTFKPRDVDPLPLGYSEADVEQFLQNQEVDKSFLNQLVKSIDADLAQYIHSRNLLQDFLAGRLDFVTVFRNFANQYGPEFVQKKESDYKFSQKELDFFSSFNDENYDFIEDYWIKNTNFVKVRKLKKGDIKSEIIEPEVDSNDPDDPTDILPNEEDKVDKEEEKSVISGGEEVNEGRDSFERTGTEYSSMELADTLSRAFVKMLPKVERVDGITKIYSEEEYEKVSDQDKQNYVRTPKGFIQFGKNSLGRLELCDYTPTWNLIALNLANKLSTEEMIQHIESNPNLVDIIPEIYIFKERLNQPITNEFKAELRSKVEVSFKKAKVGVHVLIRDERGNYLLRDEAADFVQTAKQKVNTTFINNLQSNTLGQFYNRVDGTFNAKEYLRSKKLITDKDEKNLIEVERNNEFLSDLGFVLNPQTIIQDDFIRQEIQDFKSMLVDFLSNFENVSVRIADFITEDHAKIQGLNNIFKQVYKIENEISPLVSTTMVKNAEGENQSVLSVFNSILQDREYYNNSDSLEQLNERIPRTKNDLFNYSLTKQVLFKNNERTKNSISVDILSGLKIMEQGSATKGSLTINLEEADWLKLNFIGMLKAGMIENTRAETASTSYTFRLSNWNPDYITRQLTPFNLIQTKQAWDVTKNKFVIDNSSPIYKVWSDYLKGELNRIKKQGIKIDKKGDPVEPFGLFANIIETSEKEVLLLDLFDNKPIDDIVQDNTGLILSSLNRFFNQQFLEYNDLFENVMGGYSSIIPTTRVEIDENKGDVQIYNMIYNSADKSDNKEIFKAFFVINALTIHTEETILFQGDLTESPKYFKRAKGVQSTGTPLSTSPVLVDWINRTLKEFSFGQIMGVGSYIGDTFNSATIKDDIKPSVYYTNNQLQDGYIESKIAYNEAQEISQTKEQISEEVKLLDPYAETNIGDGDGGINPDFYLTLLRRVGNVNQDQITGFKALVLDAKKNAELYNLGRNQELTDEEEKIMEEGLLLIEEGKVVFPKLKVTYRGNALSEDVVQKEIMDKFALFPLFPQFTYDKPAANHLFKQMIRENKAYVKFESGTKIQNSGVTDFLQEVEKGNFEITLQDSEHTLQTDKLREQIKTPNKVKEKNTFGSQFRKLIESGLTSNEKHLKLKSEEITGETVRLWEKLNQELSELTKNEILSEFGIKKNKEGDWNYDKLNYPKIADILLREGKRRDLPENILIYFDKYKRSKLNSDELKNYYSLFESSFGNQQIQALLASIIKKISVQKLAGAQLIQVSQSLYDRKVKQGNKTRDLGFYHFKDGKVQAAECKVSLIGDFKNLLNLQEVKDKLKDIEKPNILEQIRALNELLKDDNFVDKHKDKLTIIGYRIPTQGFNSMDVMVVREFLPTFHGPTIVCPPEITTKSGTDYDYDKLSVIFTSIDENGELVSIKSKGVQNQMIQTAAKILLDPINYHRLITPNTNKIIFDFLKGHKDSKGNWVNGLLQRLGISTKEPKNTEVITQRTNLAKFNAVKGKDLLGIAAVWNTFTTLIQRHSWKLNNEYTKVIGFDNKQSFVPVTINPVLLKNKPDSNSNQINTSKPDTEDGTSKQEIVSQLINVTVDMPSDDTFGQTVFGKNDFAALIYSTSMLGYDFKTSMLFFHQPIIYTYKKLVQIKKQLGIKERIAKFEAMSEIFGIEIPIKKSGKPDYISFEAKIFNNILTPLETSLDPSKLDSAITPVNEIGSYSLDSQQKAVLAHYLKLLDQSNEIRTIQSTFNFDTSPDNSLFKLEQRRNNYKKATKITIPNPDLRKGIVNQEYIDELFFNSVISGLYAGPILSNIANKLFPVLFSTENSIMFSELSNQYIGKEELAYRKATNDFLLSVLQSYGEFDGENIVTYADRFLRKERKSELFEQAKHIKSFLTKEGISLRLLDILLLNSSTKRYDTVFNPQVFLGFENSPEDKEKITEEWRTLLNHSDKRIQNFAKNLAVVGAVQSGWSKSPVYFSDLIPEEFITPIINNAFSKYQLLNNDQKSKYRRVFQIMFDQLEGGTLGRKDQRWVGGIIYQKDPYRFIDYRIDVSNVVQSKPEVENIISNDVQESTNTQQGQLDLPLGYNQESLNQFQPFFGPDNSYNTTVIEDNNKGVQLRGKTVGIKKLSQAPTNVNPELFKKFLSFEDTQIILVEGLNFNIKGSTKRVLGTNTTNSREQNRVYLDTKANSAILLHELIHYHTSNFIDNKPNDSSVKELKKLYKYVSNNSSVKHYGLTDIHEFIAEAFSNYEFSKLLQSLPYQSTNLLDWLLTTIGKLLGVKKSLFNSVYKEGMEIIRKQQNSNYNKPNKLSKQNQQNKRCPNV